MTSTTSGTSKDQSGSGSGGGSGGGPSGNQGSSGFGRSGATDSLRQHLHDKLQAKAGGNLSSSPFHPPIGGASGSSGSSNSVKSDNLSSPTKSKSPKRNRQDNKNSKSSTNAKQSKSTKEKVDGNKSGFLQSIKPQSPNRSQNSSYDAAQPGNGQCSKVATNNDDLGNEISGSSSGINYAATTATTSTTNTTVTTCSVKSNSSDSLNNSSGKNNKSVVGSCGPMAKCGDSSEASVDKVTSSIKNSETTSSSVSTGEDTETVEDISITEKGKERKEPVRGRAWKDSQGVYIRYKSLADGVIYKPGDAVYIESQPDLPFFICTIVQFKRHKRERDTLMVHIKWFYRPCEVPETVYQLLIQDRTTLEASPNGAKSENIADQLPELSGRELFISDATDTYPVSVLRGLCRVEHFAELSSLVQKFKPGPDCFFYVLGYNPETRRLASTQGEIRVGGSHQARLPELQTGRPVDCEEWEELCWKPGVTVDADLVMYLRAARSMAAFAGMCNGGSTDDGYLTASRDDITINALSVLHENGYDSGKSLQALVKCPVPKGIDKKWSEDETKRFVKGLRQFGKNFFRIKKELLPNKETGELIEFYYLWKKTPAAAPSRTHRRHRRQSVLRRIRAPRNPRNNKEDPGYLSSASEEDNSEDDSDSLSGYHCRHCFTTSSKDWHHAGKDKVLLCTDCRIHFKKYGDLPQLDVTKDPPYLFRPVAANDEEGSRVRTRTRAKELVNSPPNNARNRPKRGSGTSTPEPEMKISGRKSPGAASNTSSSSDKSKNKSNAASPAPRGRKRGKESEDEKSSRAKKRKEDRGESPSCSSIASSVDEDNEIDSAELGNDEMDNDNVDNENSSRASSPNPDPDTGRDNDAANVAASVLETDTNNKKSPKTDITPDGVEESVDSSAPESQSSAEVKKSDSVNSLLRTKDESSVDLKKVKVEPGDSALNSSNTSASQDEIKTENSNADGFVRVKEEFISDTDALRNNINKDSKSLEDIKNSNSTFLAESSRSYAESNGLTNSIKEEKAGRPAHLNLSIVGSAFTSTPNGNGATFPVSESESSTTESPASGGLITIKDQKSLMSPIEDLKPPGISLSSKPSSFNDEGTPLLGSFVPNNNSLLGSATVTSIHGGGGYPLPQGMSKTSPPSGLFQSGLPPPLVSSQQDSNDKDGPPPPMSDPSIYSSPLSRFYPPQHPGIGHYPFVPHHFPPHPHSIASVVSESPSSVANQQPPLVVDMKAESMPNPLQSLREVKVPGYPTFDAPPLNSTTSTTNSNSNTSVTSTASISPFPPTTTTTVSSDKIKRESSASNDKDSSDRRNSVGGGESEQHRDRSDREREKLDREREKTKSPKVSSFGPPSVTMVSNTMTTPAGPQGPIPHPNVHPLAGPPGPFPGAFHPHHPHAHPLYHHYPYGPYFNPYAFSPYPPGPQGMPPRLPPGMPSAPQAARPSSPANHLQSSSGGGKSNMSDVSPGSHHSSSSHHKSSSSSSKHGSSRDSNHSHSQHSSHNRSSSSSGLVASAESNDADNHDNDDGDEIPSPHGVPRGPSPEPKVEDSECHRSQSAIFLRHWNRGDFNSCARTDLTFKPVPDSKLARKREERLRKQAEKERDERERAAQARKQISGTPDREKRETPKPGNNNMQQSMGGPPGGLESSMVNSPFDRFTPRPGAFGDTPALRQLSEYARPHTGFSPGGGMRPGPGGMLPPHPLDPMLGGPYQMLYGQAAARERMEMEALEKREREIREIRERELSDRLKEEFLRNIPGGGGNGAQNQGGPPGSQRMPNPLDPHWLDAHRRFGALGPGGPQLSQLHQGFGLYAPQGPPNALSPLERERLGIPTSVGLQFSTDQLADRLQAERMAMDMRLQMAAGQIPYPGIDPLLQAQAAAAAGAYQRQPTLIPPRDAVLGVHPDLLGRPYPPELAHHISAHEQLQRQLMMDRDRFPHPGAHPSFLAQQEEYMRQQQREREMKVRALEEAARRH